MLLVAAVSGCQTPTRSARTEQSPQPAREPGYTTEQRYTVASEHQTWTLGDHTYDVSVVRPSGSGSFPLIVYLPGLGEPPIAGTAWRTAWAQAGYVVVAIQFPGDGEGVLSSPKARSGDFVELAKQRYSPAALAERLAVLQLVFEEVQRRRASGALAGVDDAHIALAGFDLGAQTAMAAAGEGDAGRAHFDLPSSVKCIVAFSPYADFSGTAFEQRYAAIELPVMSVTSTEDADPFGVVSSPALRRAPFENMPAGHKYLLSLGGAPHALIAGSETPSIYAQSGKDNSSGQSDNASRDGSSSRHKGGMRGSQGSHRGGARDSDSGASASGPRPVSAAAWSAELGRAETVTTAYLDAFVKNDSVASEWLRKDARRWLADSADLRVK